MERKNNIFSIDQDLLSLYLNNNSGLGGGTLAGNAGSNFMEEEFERDFNARGSYNNFDISGASNIQNPFMAPSYGIHAGAPGAHGGFLGQNYLMDDVFGSASPKAGLHLIPPRNNIQDNSSQGSF
jgi:hypothetical protein